ncbi:MAG: ABC transporter ATP-binding protein [Candidatus Saccharimonadales bacterium]
MSDMSRKGKNKYALVYRHLWQTFGASWQVRVSFVLQVIARVCKFVALPVALSLLITRMSTGDYDGARQAVLLFGFFSLLLGVLAPLVRYIGMLGENKVYSSLTARYFSKLIGTDIDYFNSNMSGYLTTATRQYVDSTTQLVRALRATYINTLLSILLPLAVIMWFDVLLGAVALLLTIVQAIYLFWASKVIDPYRARSRELYKTNSGKMSDIISNILAVRSAAQERNFEGRVRAAAVDEAVVFTKRYTIQAKLIGLRECLTVIFFIVLLWLTVYQTANGSISVVIAVLTVTYATTILSGIYTLSEDLDTHDDWVDKIIPAFDVLNRQNTVNDPAEPKTLPSVAGKIAFDAVSFTYGKAQGAAGVLRDFSLAIPLGQKVGVVGLSGAGKSTLIKLLLRFNDVDAGAVSIDGIDVRDLRQADLRGAVAYVPQEPLLLHASIRQNVTLSRPDASDAEIERALKAAHAWQFVKRLPEGVESVVGERGVKLSGGQKQRIAIARAVLQGAPIMVLDEATSALDSESEQIIKDSFAEVLHGKTALVVAHRLSTLSDMDRIIVIDGGELVEDGTHHSLLAKNGVYARLWKRQQKHLDDEL